MPGTDNLSRRSESFSPIRWHRLFRLARSSIMLYWCYTIVSSRSRSIVRWSLILSVALYPAHVALSARLGGRKKLVGDRSWC